MGVLLQDLRFAVRSFLRAPRFTVPALLALALGIGSTSAIFSVVRGVILEPLPCRDPERIVAIWEHRVDRNRPRPPPTSWPGSSPRSRRWCRRGGA